MSSTDTGVGAPWRAPEPVQPTNYPELQRPEQPPSHVPLQPFQYARPAATPREARNASLTLSIVSLVVSALALLLAVVVVFTSRAAPAGDDYSGYGPITGAVKLDAGTDDLHGGGLAEAVRQVLVNDGSDPMTTKLSCPDTVDVRQGVTTICHGTIDAEDWAVVVFSEDSEAHFTLLTL